MTETSLSRHLAGESATIELGRELSLIARSGLAILLSGDLGSGKSTLARALIRALADEDESFDIPSPTFTIIQSYGQTRLPVAHADLYRLNASEEIEELGLDEALAGGVLIVEWPEKLSPRLVKDAISIELSGIGGTRTARLSATGAGAAALLRFSQISGFLEAKSWSAARRKFLEGDASFRRYERLNRNGMSFILMDMARRPDGPPVRNGKPYSQIAHLAEDISAVIAVNSELRKRGFSAPETYAVDLDKGLAIIEDLGDYVFGRMLLAGQDMAEPMKEAVNVLCSMAKQQWPSDVRLPQGPIHHIKPYDAEALEIETALLTDWCWPFLKNENITDDLRASFVEIWRELFHKIMPRHPIWTLRDFHSPNLLWLPERTGLARVGIIDTQDCVMGHPAYDLVSLIQDARVDIPRELALHLYDHYVAQRRGTGFDAEDFAAAFAILGAQRATKILGIFARLSKRDGKHGYLRHLPRVSGYLERNLQHPALAGLKAWHDRHLPHKLRISRSG